MIAPLISPIICRYHRCEFRAELGARGAKAQGQVPGEGSTVVTAYTKWSAMSHLVRKADRPVVLNRASTTNTSNPFGSTFCYPFQDLIFEVSAVVCEGRG